MANRHVVRANKIMTLFAEETGVSKPEYDLNVDTLLIDLLADLMHWAEATNVDWNEALRIADGHYGDERDRQEEDESG